MKKLVCVLSFFAVFPVLQAQEAAGNITFPKGIFRNLTEEVSEVLRLEAEDADFICDTYHFDNAINVSVIKDPDDVGGKGLNNCWNSNFAVYKEVVFKENTTKVAIRKGYPRGSKMEFWVDRVIDEGAKTMTGGMLIGSIEFPAVSTDWNRWQTFEAPVQVAAGVHNLCIVFLAGGGSAANQNYGALNWLEFTSVSEVNPNGIYNTAANVPSARYTSFTINGVEVPIIDGANPAKTKDYLDYDLAVFSAGKGRATARIQSKDVINTISVSPLKLNIPLTKVDDKTYEFDIPDPAVTPYYLLATINGKRLVIARDAEQEEPSLTADSVFDVRKELTALKVDATDMMNAKQVAAAFQAAVDKASAYGTKNGRRGVVYVPAGLYYMGNLFLKSHVSLYLSTGAVVRFSDHKEDYSDDFVKASLWSDDPAGRHGTWWICTQEGAKNIKVYGRGILDGNGYYLQKQAARNRMFCNHIFMIMQASDVHIDGLTLLQTAFWGTVVARSNDVRFTNIKFMNSMDANENDGIDVCESQNVTVDRAIGIALDDPFSTKTWAGTEMMQKWYGSPEKLDHVVFDHCVSLTYCGGFKLGHGAMQHQNDITVRNGVVVSAGRALGVEPKYGNPNKQPIGGISNVLFEDIDIENAGGEGWLKILADNPDVGTPSAENIVLRNINIRSKGSAGTLMGANDANKVEGVTFDNVRLFGNTQPVSSLAELNILKTGYYEGVTFVQDRSKDADYVIEAEYYNSSTDGQMKRNEGDASDASHPGGYIISNLKDNAVLEYKSVDLGSGTAQLVLRVNSFRAGNRAEIRLDDPQTGMLIGTQELTQEAGSAWSNTVISLQPVMGVHDLYVTFKSANPAFNLIGSFNYLELKGRSFVDLESISPVKAVVEVNLDKEVKLGVVYAPVNAYQRDVVWEVVSATPEGAIQLDKEGAVKGLKVGTAVVRATSVYDAAIHTEITVHVVDKLEYDTFRIEAESADIVCDTYHYDNAINIGAVTDPEDTNGKGLNSCWNTNFAVYKGVDFKKETVKATVRKGYPRGSKIEFWIDCTIDEANKTRTGGTLIGSVEFPSVSSDWTRWQTFETAIAGASGVHDLCIVFLAGGGSAANQNYGSLNWIELTRVVGDKGDVGFAAHETESFDLYVMDRVLYVRSDSEREMPIYSVEGELVRIVQLVQGLNSVSGLSQGFYVVNNRKFRIE